MNINETLLNIDLYDLLECSPSAEVHEIRKAFRKKSLECHPDKHPDNPNATEIFKQLNAAVELLSDKDKRAYYDSQREARSLAGLRKEMHAKWKREQAEKREAKEREQKRQARDHEQEREARDQERRRKAWDEYQRRTAEARERRREARDHEQEECFFKYEEMHHREPEYRQTKEEKEAEERQRRRLIDLMAEAMLNIKKREWEYRNYRRRNPASSSYSYNMPRTHTFTPQTSASSTYTTRNPSNLNPNSPIFTPRGFTTAT